MSEQVAIAALKAGFTLEKWMTSPPKPAMWHGTPEALHAFYSEAFRLGMKQAAQIVRERAGTIRRNNTYRGKVNAPGEFGATMVDGAAGDIDAAIRTELIRKVISEHYDVLAALKNR